MFSNLKGINFLKLDFLLLTLFFLITSFGLIAVASSSAPLADLYSSNPLLFFIKQLIHLIIGVLILFSFLFIPCSNWKRYDRILLFLGIFLLILVLVPEIAAEVNGASRWIRLGSFSIQPSEIMKFISIIYISGYTLQ